MSSSSLETDAVIVGGGLPGLVMAVEAFRRGLRARVIDRQPEAVLPAHAGCVLQPAALPPLAGLELFDPLRSQGSVIERIELHRAGEATPRATLDYADAGMPFPFALGVAHESVRHACRDAFVRYQAIVVDHGVELLALHHERGRVCGVIARGPAGSVTYRAKVVVVTTLSGGAPVRAEIGAAQRSEPYPEETAALALARPEGWPAALQVWMGPGLMVSAFPLSERMLRVEATAAAGILSGAKAGGGDALLRLLAPVAPPLEPALKSLRSPADVALGTWMRARRSRRLADAVALTGPAALAMSGASFNVDTQAVLDARALAAALSRSGFSGDFSRFALASYAEERQPRAALAALLAHDFHRAGTARSGLYARARDRALERLAASAPLRRKVVRALSGLDEPITRGDRFRLGGILPLEPEGRT